MSPRTHPWIVAPLLLALACGGAPPTPEEDRAAITGLFDRYRSAVLERDGEALAGLLSAETLAYHDALRDMVLHADRDALLAEPLLTQVQVLTMRMRITREEIEPMSGVDLVAHGVDQGWVDNPELADSRLGPIELDGDVATAQHLLSTGTVPTPLTFRRERDGWRLDATAGMLRAGEQLEKRLDAPAREQLLERIISAATGRVPTPETWAPLAGDS